MRLIRLSPGSGRVPVVVAHVASASRSAAQTARSSVDDPSPGVSASLTLVVVPVLDAYADACAHSPASSSCPCFGVASETHPATAVAPSRGSQ